MSVPMRGKHHGESLSRRERQILDVLHRMGQATVATVQRELPDPPSYSAVRALMRILEEKKHVRHRVDGPRYIYEPITSRTAASRSALRHLVKTFFRGSTEDAVVALINAGDSQLTDEEFDDLVRRIDAARRGDE
jgi:predicted transcriptional regulator